MHRTLWSLATLISLLVSCYTPRTIEDGGTSDSSLALGKQCKTDSECGLAQCVDGVCCDTPGSLCSGCQACNLVGKLGRCGNVPAGQDPHGRCKGKTGGECATGCDGKGACGVKSKGTACGKLSCKNRDGDGAPCFGQCKTSSVVAFTCDGQGLDCPPQGTEAPCGGSLICEEGAGCKKSCTVDADCVEGFYCEYKTGVCTWRKGLTLPCTRDRECQLAKCSKVSHTCVRCDLPKDCTPSVAHCENGDCLPCKGNLDCSEGMFANACFMGHCSCTTHQMCSNPRTNFCGGFGLTTCGCGAKGSHCPRDMKCVDDKGKQVIGDVKSTCKYVSGGPCQAGTDCASLSCTGNVCD